MSADVQTTKPVRLGHRSVDYSVRFSKAAQRARIKVSPQGVEVILPAQAPADRAAAFLEENADWVLDQLAFVERMGSLRRPPRRAAPDAILLRGRETPLEMVEEESTRKHCRIDHTDGRLTIRVPKGEATDPQRALEAWLRREARQDVLKLLAARSQQMRVQLGRVFIMGQRTKWGGCSRRGNLSFNWRLIQAPPEVLDYIVVHELAHLIEPYHSTKFWLIVRSYCPEFEKQRAWLREQEERLKLPLAIADTISRA